MARLVIGQKHGYEGDQSSSRASWNTPHATPRAGISYGGRMALSFALTSLVTVMILASVVMVVWGGAFSDYTRANVEEIANVVAAKIAETHRADGGWKRESLAAIAESSALSDDIGLQVMDANGKILYDDTLPARHAKEHSPVSTAPTDPESAVTVPIIAADGVRIGLSLIHI